MKARKVKLDPAAPFAQAARKILSVRLEELCSFAAAAADPRELEALHDMRIAAKRVRYVLEIAQPDSKRVKAAKELQDLLGEIHDCDELLALIERHTGRLRDQDAAAALAGEPLPNRRKYRGLEALRAHTVAERGDWYERFLRAWPKIERRLQEPEQVAA